MTVPPLPLAPPVLQCKKQLGAWQAGGREAWQEASASLLQEAGLA